MNNYEIRSQRLKEARLKGTHTNEEFNEMKAYFNYTCVRCAGASRLLNVEKDHIVPLFLGGSDSIKNIQPLCAKCNSSKGNECIDHRPTFCDGLGIDMPGKWL